MEGSSQDQHSNSPSILLALPLEICIEILASLDARSVLSCSETCKQLNALVSASVPLQYKLALAATGMIDGPPSFPLTASERLSVLDSRRGRWRDPIIGPPDASIRLPRQGTGYEFAGGYLGRCFPHNQSEISADDAQQFKLVTLPSRTPYREANVETYDLGHIAIEYHTFDPSQDLLVLLERVREDGNIKVHLRRLSIPGTAHPDATSALLSSHADNTEFVMDYELHIADDVVALFWRGPASGVIVFNWRTGEELVNMNPKYTRHPQDFAFLSPRAFLITYSIDDIVIRLFSFTSPSESNSKDLPITATIRLPPPVSGAFLIFLHVSTSPWLSHAPQTAHYPSNDRRIFTFSLAIEDSQQDRHELCITVLSRTLNAILNVAQSRRASGEPPERLVWDWTSWLPPCARVLALPRSFGWSRHVHGARMLARNERGLMILDFDVPFKDRSDEHWSSEHMSSPGDEGEKFRYFDGEPGVLNIRGLLDVSAMSEVYGNVWKEGEEDGDTMDSMLMSALPYGCVCVPAPEPGVGEYSSFMLDEERIVGVRKVLDGEVLDVWAF
ncbi:unnamed protein product [Peniophora sp. CBMAI 1063]|nr:unnamed protein product [Peniophora sp. CBMAI 1063]